ncbi:MAG: UvrB/UvrC motif-containing protein [Planctomycetes bacterium]|nr:UvrB/UvrC motif-containing protein [Planctomycetota bacterium]
MTAEQTKQRRKELKCKSCGMSVDEFRSKGRLGCADCYEVFKGPIAELLERVHGALEHVGRVPGLSDDDLERMQALSELRRELESAIREEAYESAASLRDRISQLEGVEADESEAPSHEEE